MRLPLSPLCLATLSLAITVYYLVATVLRRFHQYSGDLGRLLEQLLTLLICTWTAQHLNLPVQKLGLEPASTTEYVMSALTAF